MGQTKMSGCLYSHLNPVIPRSGRCEWLVMRRGWMPLCRGGRNHVPWMRATKQKCVWINAIKIESVGVNEWLLDAFMLAKREEGLSNHESFPFHTIFS